MTVFKLLENKLYEMANTQKTVHNSDNYDYL